MGTHPTDRPIAVHLTGMRAGNTLSGMTDALPYPPSSAQGLAARWLRWAASIPVWRTPLGDRAEYFSQNQPDDVWFLGGQFGEPSSGPDTFRRVAVPYGQPIFLPVWWAFGRGDAPGGRPDDAGVAFASLEGEDGLVELPIMDIVCDVPFTLRGAAGNPITKTGLPRKVWMWARCVQVSGLTPGRHRIVTSRSTVAEGARAVAIVYLITVQG
jgi:hypothetical protein